MSPANEFELHQMQSRSSHITTEEELGNSQVNENAGEDNMPRSQSSGRVKASVLFGAAISQLPIWGIRHS